MLHCNETKYGLNTRKTQNNTLIQNCLIIHEFKKNVIMILQMLTYI